MSGKAVMAVVAMAVGATLTMAPGAPVAAQAVAGAAMTSSMAGAMADRKVPPGYLAGKPPLDIMTVLPPPPAPGSPQDIADRTVFAASAAGIDGPAWKEAISELNPAGPEYFAKLSCAVGAKLSPETTPVTLAMVARSGVDFSGPMADAKNAYKRPRPFSTDKSRACDPSSADGIGARLGYAYPSGHAGVGWLWAMMLSQAAPARAEQIRAFGMATGDLRVACRVHWLSDVAYGRVLATSLYERLWAEPEFRADLARAKAELARAPAPTCP